MVASTQLACRVQLTHASNMSQSSRLNLFNIAILLQYLPAKKTVEIPNSIHELRRSG